MGKTNFGMKIIQHCSCFFNIMIEVNNGLWMIVSCNAHNKRYRLMELLGLKFETPFVEEGDQ